MVLTYQNLSEEFTEDRVDNPTIHRLKKLLLTRNYEGKEGVNLIANKSWIFFLA